MLALEALSLFSTKTRRQGIDLQCVLSASKNPRYRKNIHITEHNSLIQQHIKVSKGVVPMVHDVDIVYSKSWLKKRFRFF